MKYVCLIIGIFFIANTTSASKIVDTVPPLTIIEKANILNYAIGVKYGYSKVRYNGRNCFQVNWLLSHSLYRNFDGIKNWVKMMNYLMIDFVLRDSLAEYDGIVDVLNFKGVKEPLQYYSNVGGEISRDSLLEPRYEGYTVHEKINLFLGNSFYKVKYGLDSLNKTINFFGDKSLQEQTGYCADFIFAYILRNRYNQFNKVIFNYKNDQGELVRDIYKADSKVWYNFEQVIGK